MVDKHKMKIDMKNIIITILLGLLLTNCSNDDNYTEEECINSVFYYYSNEKIYLNNLNESYLIIGFNHQTDDSTITNFINKLNSFESITNEDIWTINNEYKFTFAKFKLEKSCIEINAEIDNLNSKDIVIYANKTYNTDFFGNSGNFDLMYTTDQFIIKLKENTSKSQLDNLISKTKNISIIKENEFIKNQFLMSNTSKNRNTIETSNLFYEKGLFEFSEPNFGYVNF